MHSSPPVRQRAVNWAHSRSIAANFLRSIRQWTNSWTASSSPSAPATTVTPATMPVTIASPGVGVFVATRFSTNAALLFIGGSILVAGVLLYWANPPMVHEDEIVDGPKPRVSEWLRGRIVGVLIVCIGEIVCLSGMEVSAIASLEHIGKASWLGIVFFAMCAASIVGGLVYGGVKRVPSVLVLLVVMAACEIPVGLGDGSVLWLCVLLIPMNLVCAPLIAACGEQVSRLAPPTARGLAMGLQGSAFTIGGAIGSPLAGVAIDHGGAPAGFAIVGVAGLLVAGVAWALARQRQQVIPLPAG